MADKTRKVPDNVPGPFYVDQDCDDCSLCVDIAPDSFLRNSEGWSFVARQPETDDEKSLCDEALDCCPGESIGSDG